MDKESKICSRCRQRFPQTIEFFSRDASRKDGFNVYCKTCTRARCHDYQVAHKEEIAAHARARLAARKEQAAAAHRYYVAHKEELTAKAHARLVARKEWAAAAHRAYREAHPILSRQAVVPKPGYAEYDRYGRLTTPQEDARR